ncbi:hypothetical protein [Romboutsia sp.]|uniref:hypothetical protein n=1 Tax=Romboutsia sp. TaxID=1965302 RepID=UPI003F3A6AD9
MREIINPDLYHCSRKSSDFFEGWYFKIVDNRFTLNNINLDLEYTNEANIKNYIKGNLEFINIFKWKDNIITPGSMECYSQVCALDGDILGNLNINGEDIDFKGFLIGLRIKDKFYKFTTINNSKLTLKK